MKRIAQEARKRQAVYRSGEAKLQKCGIIERENYSKPKSEDAKQPQCPIEKEDAIKEVLEHFGMI